MGGLCGLSGISGLSGLAGRRVLFRATFVGASGAGLSAAWTAALGAFDLDGAGRARGKTLEADGNELVVNGNMETGDPPTGWTAIQSTILSAAEERTGGAGTKSLRLGRNGSNYAYVYQALSAMSGVTYTVSGWRRNVTATSAGILFADPLLSLIYYSSGYSASATWNRVSGTGHVTNGARIWCVTRNDEETQGLYALFDDVSVQAQLAIATHDLGRADHDLRIRFITPASGAVPGGYIVRYQDAANYWLWSINPGISGSGLELIEVHSGMHTSRASAEIGWTVSTPYNLRLVSKGNVYTAYVNGTQAATYTDGGSFLHTATKIGLWEAGADNVLTEQVAAYPC